VQQAREIDRAHRSARQIVHRLCGGQLGTLEIVLGPTGENEDLRVPRGAAQDVPEPAEAFRIRVDEVIVRNDGAPERAGDREPHQRRELSSGPASPSQ
jgi:hypothetical protein